MAEICNESVWIISHILGRGPPGLQYAITILNQPILSDPDLIKSLWKNASLRVTVDGGSNRWHQFIKENGGQDLSLPDCITGDFDSITESTKEYFNKKSVRFVDTPDQDETDFTKSLREIKSMMENNNLKMDYILALVTNSGRIDHIMGNLETLHIGKNLLGGIPIILMSSNSLTWLLDAGKKHIIHVPKGFVAAKHSLGLIPLSGPTYVTTSGLKYDLENEKLAFGKLVSTSNTFSKSVVRIHSDKDLVWTVQYSCFEV